MLEGEEFQGVRVLKFHSPNRYTHKILGQVTDGEPSPDVTLTGNRIGASPSVQTTSRREFKEFCRLMEGRWGGDVIWVANWPGFGKRGDKVTAYAENLPCG
jgi:hypothetical protein